LRNERLLTWMLGLLTGLAGAAALWLLWRLLRDAASLAAVTAAGVLLAMLLQPLAEYVQRIVRWRPLTALAVMLLVLAPFVVVAVWLVATVVGQAHGLLARLPTELAYARALLSQLQAGLAKVGVHVNLAGALPTAASSVLHGSIKMLSGAATITADSVVALVVAFLLLWDGPRIGRSLHEMLPPAWRAPSVQVTAILGSSVVGYIRAQFLVAAVFGVLIGGSMALLGLPDPVLLGFLAGLFEMLPMVGPILAGVGPVALALAQPFPHVLWVLLVFVAAQQLESNVLVPRISGGAVHLHPLTVILAVFGGWTIGGLGGALLAVPVVAVGRDLLRLWWRPTPSPPDGAFPRPAPVPLAGAPAGSVAHAAPVPVIAPLLARPARGTGRRRNGQTPP
jgi:predicted PurR-regulated permease PerM